MKARALLSIALAVGALVPVPAAGHGEGSACASNLQKPWIGAAECHFLFRGFPITITGEASAATDATVHVWVTPEAGAPVLASCVGEGQGVASCDATFGPALPDPIPLTSLVCHVEGSEQGTHSCISASGR